MPGSSLASDPASSGFSTYSGLGRPRTRERSGLPARLPEWPGRGHPVRHEAIELGLERRAHRVVDDPPRHAHVVPGVTRWIEIHAAEQPGLVLIEDRVIERLVGGDLPLVALEVLTILLEG